MISQSGRRRGRPKLKIALIPSDRKRLEVVLNASDSKPREKLVARCLLLAATGEHTHHQIAQTTVLDLTEVSASDIVDLAKLLHRLSQRRIKAVEAVWLRLSPATRASISVPGITNPDKLKQALADEFSAMVRSGTLFEPRHLEHINLNEDLEESLRRRPQGTLLWRHNRELLSRVLDDHVRKRKGRSASVSQVQTWVSRFRKDGNLDEVLVNRHLRPRKEFKTLEGLVWLVAGIELGQLKKSEDAVLWMRRRNRRLKATTTERYVRNWIGFRNLPLAERMRKFLASSGFIHWSATVDHRYVVAALERLAQYKQNS